MDGGLADGKYTVREIECADGYILDTQPKTIYVEYGGCTTITWKNTAVTGQIQVTKTSADYNSMNGWPAGTPIPGTVFEVYHYRTGNLVDTIRTDKNGVAVSKPVPPIEGRERRGGVVGDVGEGVTDILSGHDLGIAGFLNGHIGVKALVGHSRFDDLPSVFDLHVDGGLVQGVEVRRLGFHHLVPAQGQGLGHGHAVLVGADGIDKVPGAVVHQCVH